MDINQVPDIQITFEGHGTWGVGGGGLPEDGLYHGTIKPESVEFRGPRDGSAGKQKFYFTVVHDGGYEMFDNVSIPAPGGPKGTERAFCTFLLATGLIAQTSAEAVRAGGLKGKGVSVKQVFQHLKTGPGVWFDYKKPRAKGDYKDLTYLLDEEVAKVQAGTLTIADGRAPMPATATAAPAAALSLPTAAASAPTVAMPPQVAPAAAVALPVVAPVVTQQPAAAGAVSALLSL
jgi:hypothetical protein